MTSPENFETTNGNMPPEDTGLTSENPETFVEPSTESGQYFDAAGEEPVVELAEPDLAEETLETTSQYTAEPNIEPETVELDAKTDRRKISKWQKIGIGAAALAAAVGGIFGVTKVVGGESANNVTPEQGTEQITEDGQVANNPAEATNSQPNNEQGVTNNEVSVGEFDDKYLNADVEPKYDAKQLIEQINYIDENHYKSVNSDIYIKALRLTDQGKIEQVAKVLEENGIGQADMAILSVASETNSSNTAHYDALYGRPMANYYNIVAYFRSNNIPEKLPIWGDTSLQPTGFYTLEYLTGNYFTQAGVESLGGNSEAIKDEIQYQTDEINKESGETKLSALEIEERQDVINDLNKLPEVIDYYETKQANEK